MEMVRTNAGKVGERIREESSRGQRGVGRNCWKTLRAPRANELKQETGKGLPLNLSAVMVVVVVFTQKVRAAVWRQDAFWLQPHSHPIRLYNWACCLEEKMQPQRGR